MLELLNALWSEAWSAAGNLRLSIETTYGERLTRNECNRATRLEVMNGGLTSSLLSVIVRVGTARPTYTGE